MQIPFPLLPKNKWYKVTNSPSRKIFPSFSKLKVINCLPCYGCPCGSHCLPCYGCLCG